MNEPPPDRLRQILETRVRYRLPGMEEVDVQRELAYRTVDGRALRMDVYRAPGLGARDRRPAVLFVHGGPLPPVALDGPFTPRHWGTFGSYGELAAAAGLVGVTFDHRYSGLDALPGSMDDVAAAIGFVRDRAGELRVDPDRLALWVFSGAGLHLSLALREPRPYLRCLLAFYPVLDLAAFAAMGLPTPSEGAEAFVPRDHLPAGGVPPLFLGLAGGDLEATRRSQQDFVVAALAHRVPLTLMNHPAGAHGFDAVDDDERTREIVAAALAFVGRHLGG